MAKLLAALNLPQVGEIKMLPAGHPDDGEGDAHNIRYHNIVGCACVFVCRWHLLQSAG